MIAHLIPLLLASLSISFASPPSIKNVLDVVQSPLDRSESVRGNDDLSPLKKRRKCLMTDYEPCLNSKHVSSDAESSSDVRNIGSTPRTRNMFAGERNTHKDVDMNDDVDDIEKLAGQVDFSKPGNIRGLNIQLGKYYKEGREKYWSPLPTKKFKSLNLLYYADTLRDMGRDKTFKNNIKLDKKDKTAAAALLKLKRSKNSQDKSRKRPGTRDVAELNAIVGDQYNHDLNRHEFLVVWRDGTRTYEPLEYLKGAKQALQHYVSIRNLYAKMKRESSHP